MKKLLLGLGAITSIAAPVAAVISCNNDNKDKEYKVNVDLGTKVFAASNTATTAELTKGLKDVAQHALDNYSDEDKTEEDETEEENMPTLEEVLESFAPLVENDISPNHPVGPNSGIAHNYSGAIGIIVATYTNLLKENLNIADNQDVMQRVQEILKALLLNKEILTNNNTQNLNTQATADTLYAAFKAAGVAGLKGEITDLDSGLMFKAGANKGKGVLISFTKGYVTFSPKTTPAPVVKYDVDVTEGTTAFTASNTATTPELTEGLDTVITAYAPLVIADISPNHPVGPNSGIAHNYSGAIGILNGIQEDLLKNEATISADGIKVLENVQAILKALLLDKTILTNNATQNLNTQATAQKLFDAIVALKVAGLKGEITDLDSGLMFKAGANKDKGVSISVTGGVVSFTAKA